MLTRADIEARLPHAGSMCLLDRVVTWDEARIRCESSPPTPNHPLAVDGEVPVIAAVEYAAQATAVDGALLDGRCEPRAGLLASVSEVELGGRAFDADSGALVVDAHLLVRGAGGCLYDFSVRDGRATNVRGRLLVAFDRAPTDEP